MPDVFGIVLAGGEGKRLAPLTADRAKPAVPFGGNYRLIDFALSNLVNAGFRQIVVLTQYKSHSLDRHISTTWRLSPLLGNYVAPVPAQMRRGPRWFSGSADAIYQNFNLLHDERPDYVAVFGADHIYRMDPRQMVDQHIASGAAVTVAALRAPLDQADQFGVIETAADGQHDHRLPREADGRRRAARRARPGLRLDGQLRLHRRGADRRGHRRRRGRRAPSTTWAATSSRRSSSSGEAHVYDFSRNEVPGASDARPRLLARRRDARRLLRRAHGPHLGRPDVQPLQPASGRSSPGPIRCRRPSSSSRRGRPARPGAGLDGVRRRRHLRRHGAPLGALAGRRTCTPTPRSRTRSLMQGVDVGRRAVVRRAILDKNVRIARGRADRRRPRGRPRALHGLRGRRRGHPQGHDGGRREGRAAHARVPAGRLRRGRRARRVPRARAAQRSIDVDVHAWGADRDAARIGHEAWDALAGAGAGAGRAARDVDRPDDGGGHGRAPTSSTATPGTRTSAATWPSSSTTSRTSPPCTRSSRCARGRPSSSAAATRCRSFCERTALEAADAIVAVSEGMRARHARRLPGDRPRPRVDVIYNGIDTDEYAPDPGTDVLERHGIDPDAPTVVFVGRITRQKGVAHLLEAMRHVDAERPARAVRRRAGHAGDRRRGRAPRRGAAGPARQRAVARRDAAQARGHPDPQPRDRLRVPVDLRAAGHRQPRGDGLRDRGRGDRHRRHRRGRRRRRDRPARARSSPATTPPASRATRTPSRAAFAERR